jgi:hypothetical protein
MSKGIELIKRKRMIIGISIGVGLVVLGVILFLVFNKKDESLKKEDKKEEEKEVVEEKQELLPLYVNDIKTDKVSIYSTRVKLYSEDIDSGSDVVEDASYGGYYVTKLDGVYYLKRNAELIHPLPPSNSTYAHFVTDFLTVTAVLFGIDVRISESREGSRRTLTESYLLAII